MNHKIRVGIFGASGYVGQDLIEVLRHHPNVEMIFATSDSFAGESVPDTRLTYIPHQDASLDLVDAVFLALPHKASAPVAAKALAEDVRVIDLSADLRLKTAESYTEWYQVTHPHPELLPVPYGLPEIHRQDLHGIPVVAVPGCYPTATLLGLYPLLQLNLLAPRVPIIVDAKSGVSGAGRTATAKTHFVEVFGNLSPYNVGRAHRHVGEIEQEILQLAVGVGPVIFTPHLIPVDRGLMASIYVTLNPQMPARDIQEVYEELYGEEPFVEVLPTGKQATLKHVTRTNKCTISITQIDSQYIHITSVIDNLRKGAAGQAVQDFNLMYQFPETTALL